MVTGYEKGSLLDFNYKIEPLPGKFPFPGLGPFDLLKESFANYIAKMMFRWTYYQPDAQGEPSAPGKPVRHGRQGAGHPLPGHRDAPAEEAAMTNEELILERLARIEERLEGVERVESSWLPLTGPLKISVIWAGISPC